MTVGTVLMMLLWTYPFRALMHEQESAAEWSFPSFTIFVFVALPLLSKIKLDLSLIFPFLVPLIENEKHRNTTRT